MKFVKEKNYLSKSIMNFEVPEQSNKDYEEQILVIGETNSFCEKLGLFKQAEYLLFDYIREL